VKVLNKVLMPSLIIVVLSVVACSKDKEDPKTKVNAGARPVDAATAALQQQQAAQGIELSLISMSKSNSGGNILVETVVQAGSQTRTIGLLHAPNANQTSTSPSAQIGGLQINAQSYCASADCNYYIIMIDARQSGYMLYQLGILREFSSGLTLYKIQPGDSPISFDNMYDVLVDSL
jgi:hypothetical protein